MFAPECALVLGLSYRTHIYSSLTGRNFFTRNKLNVIDSVLIIFIFHTLQYFLNEIVVLSIAFIALTRSICIKPWRTQRRIFSVFLPVFYFGFEFMRIWTVLDDFLEIILFEFVWVQPAEHPHLSRIMSGLLKLVRRKLRIVDLLSSFALHKRNHVVFVRRFGVCKFHLVFFCHVFNPAMAAFILISSQLRFLHAM